MRFNLFSRVHEVVSRLPLWIEKPFVFRNANPSDVRLASHGFSFLFSAVATLQVFWLLKLKSFRLPIKTSLARVSLVRDLGFFYRCGWESPLASDVISFRLSILSFPANVFPIDYRRLGFSGP